MLPAIDPGRSLRAGGGPRRHEEGPPGSPGGPRFVLRVAADQEPVSTFVFTEPTMLSVMRSSYWKFVGVADGTELPVTV